MTTSPEFILEFKPLLQNALRPGLSALKIQPGESSMGLIGPAKPDQPSDDLPFCRDYLLKRIISLL